MTKKISEDKIIANLLELYQNKRFKELEDEALNYVDELSKNIAFLNLLAATKNYLGKYNEAVKYFKIICTLQPNEAQNFANAGTALHDIGKNEEAIKYFDKSLSLQPKNFKILAQVGYIYVSRLQGDKALNYLKKALEIEPRPEIIFNIAESYRLLGNEEKAVENYSKAIKIKPELPQANYKLGLLFQEKGEYEQSIKYLKLAGEYLDSEEKLLQSKYLIADYKAFEESLDNIQHKKDSSRLLQQISSHASIHLNQADKYNFCRNPFDMIFHENISELKKGNYFLLQLLQDLKNPEIDLRHQDLLFNGSQSNGNIFDIKSKSINTLKKIIISKINKFKEIHIDSSSNIIKKWPKESILNGWYIKMQKGGYLDPHIHENGWVSGSIYLTMPEDSDENEGCIEFSFEAKKFPPLKGKGPKKTYKPLVGDIIMFPSSLTHQTTPFKSVKNRICIAFDLKPF